MRRTALWFTLALTACKGGGATVDLSAAPGDGGAGGDAGGDAGADLSIYDLTDDSTASGDGLTDGTADLARGDMAWHWGDLSDPGSRIALLEQACPPWVNHARCLGPDAPIGY